MAVSTYRKRAMISTNFQGIRLLSINRMDEVILGCSKYYLVARAIFSRLFSNFIVSS